MQGFPACWWLWQHGYENVVALMGATCSTDQANAIVGLSRPNTRIWCFTDGHKVGRNAPILCSHNSAQNDSAGGFAQPAASRTTATAKSSLKSLALRPAAKTKRSITGSLFLMVVPHAFGKFYFITARFFLGN